MYKGPFRIYDLEVEVLTRTAGQKLVKFQPQWESIGLRLHSYSTTINVPDP